MRPGPSLNGTTPQHVADQFLSAATTFERYALVAEAERDDPAEAAGWRLCAQYARSAGDGLSLALGIAREVRAVRAESEAA